MSFRATEASRLHSARPIPLGDWLSARAHASNMRCVLRALRVTQLPDGKGPRLLQPCVIQFSSAPAHVFIDAHLRVGAGGGIGGGGLVDRSIGRLIDRPVDKKDELAAFRQPPWAFVFVMWRHSFAICTWCDQRLPSARLHVWISCFLVGPPTRPQGTCCVCRSSSR